MVFPLQRGSRVGAFVTLAPQVFGVHKPAASSPAQPCHPPPGPAGCLLAISAPNLTGTVHQGLLFLPVPLCVGGSSTLRPTGSCHQVWLE